MKAPDTDAKLSGEQLNQVKRMTMMGLIEMDLQQGWMCLGADQFELAKKHFSEAASKVEEMERLAAEQTKPEQLELVPEEKHEVTQLILEV